VTIGVAIIETAHALELEVREVFLRRDATYAVVREALRKAGEPMALDLNSMWGALADRGMVEVDTKSGGKATVRVRVKGVQQRFVKCSAAILSEEDDDADDR
jgi:hypothetical protein